MSLFTAVLSNKGECWEVTLYCQGAGSTNYPVWNYSAVPASIQATSNRMETANVQTSICLSVHRVIGEQTNRQTDELSANSNWGTSRKNTVERRSCTGSVGVVIFVTSTETNFDYFNVSLRVLQVVRTCVCVCVCMCVLERERERQTDRQRDTVGDSNASGSVSSRYC